MAEILLSGTLSGESSVEAGHVFELEDSALGASLVSGAMVLIKGTHGYISGGSLLALWGPEKIDGHGRLIGALEVIRTPHPVFQDPQARKCFRWGHQFGPGDLEFVVTGDGGINPLGASCISFTLYQIQRGCFPKQVGPKGRKPVTRKVGVYYATGTAGECGQPGLWMVRWCYRETLGAAPQYGDCYFYVVDAVLCPTPGDTLRRVAKWGWGST